ncbi:PREDICTED: serine/threonine-protein phosphatase 4 regulatory subunit 2-like [Dinoponera quadriceps]|uniref:Serine/threonine-protein phosphatase 4 regulatory subunit 2-like n=1 Tax=Dinoponera quadriceps TaxID=609295 RepID=A0A6P3XYX6_DINQU|nr:PREDICTED: serine/threonine-protein phosphatase 4 regulatory subunit 2-like [Dinoponera quadriceps]
MTSAYDEAAATTTEHEKTKLAGREVDNKPGTPPGMEEKRSSSPISLATGDRATGGEESFAASSSAEILPGESLDEEDSVASVHDDDDEEETGGREGDDDPDDPKADPDCSSSSLNELSDDTSRMDRSRNKGSSSEDEREEAGGSGSVSASVIGQPKNAATCGKVKEQAERNLSAGAERVQERRDDASVVVEEEPRGGDLGRTRCEEAQEEPRPEDAQDQVEIREIVQGCQSGGGFYEAVRSGNVKRVSALIAAGCVQNLDEPDWNVSGDPPLLVAATNQCLPVLR